MEFTAQIIAVGTELLLGDIVNTNAQFLSQKLAEMGIGVYRQSVIGDNPERLKEELRKALKESNIVILTGGLGPTKDDLTKETVCALLGLTLELSEPHLEKMKDRFMHRETGMPESNIKQAMFPKEGFILENDHGTAPGLALSAGDQHILLLPGPPYEMKPMFDNYAAPYLREKTGHGIIESQSIEFFGIGESALAERLGDLLDNKNPTVAPYAAKGQCRIRVSARAESKEEAEEMIAKMVERIKVIDEEDIYSYTGQTMEEAAVEKLRVAKKTVAVAESLTGGLVTERITAVPGASEVLSGGFCTYTAGTKAKMLDLPRRAIKKYGTVSAPIAAAMAAAARRHTGAHLGLSATGVAGPGLDEKGNPVGTVFVALHDGKHHYVKQLSLGHFSERETIRFIAATHALDLVRRYCDPDLRGSLETICLPEKQVKKVGNGFFRRAVRRLVPQRGDSAGLVINKLLFILCLAAVVTVAIFTGRYYYNLQNEQNVNVLAASLIGTPAGGDLPDGFRADFGGLYDLNNDFAGFIQFDGLLQPVVQGVDNTFYLSHGFLKADYPAGAAFLDYRNGTHWLSDQTILYAGGSLRDKIKSYENADYMEENLEIVYNSAYADHTFVALGAAVVNTNEAEGRVFQFADYLNRNSDEQMQAYLDELALRFFVKSSVRVEPVDKLLTVVIDTGEYDGQKLIVVFREKHENEQTDAHIASENPDAVRDDAYYIRKGEPVPTIDMPFADYQAGKRQESSSSEGSSSESSSSSSSSSSKLPVSSSSKPATSSSGGGGETPPPPSDTTEEEPAPPPTPPTEEHPYGMATISGYGEMDMAEAIARIVRTEVGTSMPPEAIKAQAVAVHTYILYRNGLGLAADLTPYPVNTAAQQAEVARVRAVIEPVLGKVLYYGGKVIYSPFFASAAGRTNSNQETFGSNLPYLVSVESPYDQSYDPQWQSVVTMSVDEVRGALTKMVPGVDLSGDPSGWFEIVSYTSGGYVNAMKIGGQTRYSGGAITGQNLRYYILTNANLGRGSGYALRSHWFTIGYENGTFTFTTRGYGHGVGMSQRGAQGYAAAGWSYSQILSHYYTGVSIVG